MGLFPFPPPPLSQNSSCSLPESPTENREFPLQQQEPQGLAWSWGGSRDKTWRGRGWEALPCWWKMGPGGAVRGRPYRTLQVKLSFGSSSFSEEQ